MLLTGFLDRIEVLQRWVYGYWNRNLGFLQVDGELKGLQRLELTTAISIKREGEYLYEIWFGSCRQLSDNYV